MDEFETTLINLFNESQLPFEAKRYVLKHVYNMVDAKYQAEMLKIKAESESKGHDNGGCDREDK